MKLTGKNEESNLPQQLSHDKHPAPAPSAAMNGSAKNGRTSMSNGSLNSANSIRNGKAAVTRVNLPGKMMYDDSYIDREEYVRLVIQSLRDVGYIESAAMLEAESGYIMESPEVGEFRQCILDASWAKAEAALLRIGVPDAHTLAQVRYLIHRQRYFELLEQGRTSMALGVLRNDIVPLEIPPDQVQDLSSLLMCNGADELRGRASWDGANGASRRTLLSQLQRYIPSSIMIQPRRMSVLLSQAQSFQRQRCTYHNAPPTNGYSGGQGGSLYIDHECDISAFPRATTLILEEHADEVWNLSWNHAGTHLATAGKDKRALVWRIGSNPDPSSRECVVEWDFSDHQDPVNCVEWSLDDTILLTAADRQIRMFDVRSGSLLRILESHSETVTALTWLPDNSGFISGAMDRKIILWDMHGKQRDTWGTTSTRVTDLAVTPDMRRVISLGMYYPSTPHHDGSATPPLSASITASANTKENRMIIYDFASKRIETSLQLDGELTSVKVSADSHYAIINHSPDEVLLWDFNLSRISRRFTGQRQRQHVLRSCFGGTDGNFVASGSEDGSVYVWHRDSGALLETLPGHGAGSVNAVAWNPRSPRMFASCSDDHTVRVWEAPPAPPPAPVGVLPDPEMTPDGLAKGKGRIWDSAENGTSAMASTFAGQI